MLLRNVRLQLLLVAGVSALLGYSAAYGKLNPFAQANAQIAQHHARIDELQKQLEQQLKNLTRGIRLP